MVKKGLTQANTLRSNNTTSTGYGIVYADEIIGGRSVKTRKDVDNLPDWVLGEDDGLDIGTTCYVQDEDCQYIYGGNGWYKSFKFIGLPVYAWYAYTTSAGASGEFKANVLDIDNFIKSDDLYMDIVDSLPHPFSTIVVFNHDAEDNTAPVAYITLFASRDSRPSGGTTIVASAKVFGAITNNTFPKTPNFNNINYYEGSCKTDTSTKITNWELTGGIGITSVLRKVDRLTITGNTIKTSEIDFTAATLQKFNNSVSDTSRNICAQYSVVDATRNNIVGQMLLIGDSLGHMVTEILTTSATLHNGIIDWNQHIDTVVNTYIRRNHVKEGGTSSIAVGSWSTWTYYSGEGQFNDFKILVAEELNKKVNTSDVVQQTGDSTTSIMSQKAVSYELANLKEDLTFVKESERNVLKLADRSYAPEKFSGKGYKILRKNMVDGNNILTQDMINEPNTIYEIRYDFDLNGQTIVCSNSSKLYFTSGSLNNGKIIFNKEIDLYGNVKLYENLKINLRLGSGSSWIKHIHYPIYMSWFIKQNEDIRDNDGNIKFDILYYRFYNMFEHLYYNTNANITLIVENDNYIISDNIVVPRGVTIDFQNSTLRFSENVLNGEYVFNLGIDKDVFDSYKNNFDIPDETKYKMRGYSSIKTCLKNIIINENYNNLHLILSVTSCKLEHITYTGKGSNNILFYQPKGNSTYAYLDMFEMYHIDLGSTFMTPLDKLTKVYINIGDAKSIEHIAGGNWYIENSQRTIIRHAINCVFNLIDSTVGLYNIHNEFNDNIYINNGVVLIQDSYLFLKGNVDDRNDRCLITLDKKYNDKNSQLSNSTSILTLVNTVIGSEDVKQQFKGNSRYYIQAINGAQPILNFINSYVVLNSLLLDISNNIIRCRSKYLCDNNVLYTAKNVVSIHFLNGNVGYNFNLSPGDPVTFAIVSKHYKRNTIYGIYKDTQTFPENKSISFGWSLQNENTDLCDFDIYLSFDNANYTKLIKFNNIVGTIGNNYCYIPFNSDYMFGNKVEDINISFSDFNNKFTNDMICNKYYYNGDDDIVTYICETEANFYHLTNECKKQDIIKYNDHVYRFSPNIGKFVSTDKTTGTSSERPNLTNLDEGFEYYDTTLKKKIIWNGTTWVNFDGTELS